MSEDSQRQDEVHLLQACPDPFARQLLKWMRFHEKYTIQGNCALAAAGLETREPYTDISIIEFLLTVPPRYQIRPASRNSSYVNFWYPLQR